MANNIVYMINKVERETRSLATISLSDIADVFLCMAKNDVGISLRFLDDVVRFVPHCLRSAIGRYIYARIDRVTLDRLKFRAEGRSLQFTWMRERDIRAVFPCFPFPTRRLEYEFYESIIEQYSSSSARNSLLCKDLIVLGLRRRSSTLFNKGRGVYDDKIIVLNGSRGINMAATFPACTEPGAQYSQRASKNPSGYTVDDRYSEVKYKKTDGYDMNGDGIRDSGCLVEGTYKYYEKVGGYLGARAFKVRESQTVSRDTDGDGLFSESNSEQLDRKGAGTSILIHRGGDISKKEINTWSAGCQTIPGDLYNKFLGCIGSQKSFYYVLVNAVEA